MIILRQLLLLTNLHLKLLSTQGTGADKLLSTQRVKVSKYCYVGASLDKLCRGGAHKSTGPLCVCSELKIRQVKDPTCSQGCSVAKFAL